SCRPHEGSTGPCAAAMRVETELHRLRRPLQRSRKVPPEISSTAHHGPGEGATLNERLIEARERYARCELHGAWHPIGCHTTNANGAAVAGPRGRCAPGAPYSTEIFARFTTSAQRAMSR